MNTRLLLKMLFFILMLLLLLLMGMHNRNTVDFTLPPVVSDRIRQPAALMYFAFFAIGVFTGMIITAPGKKSGGAKPGKGDK